jgi:uncharacterized repeat protein (TIGR01451 family)
VKKQALYFITALALVLCMTLPLTTPVMAGQISGTKNAIPPLPNIYRIGDTIYYAMTVTNPVSNTANNTLTNVWDTLPNGSIHWFVQEGVDPPIVQTPGNTTTFYWNYTVAAVDVVWLPGPGYYGVKNIFQATGFDSNGDSVAVYVTKNSQVIQPDIDIEKYTNGQDADAPTGPLIAVGANVTWTYVVTNTGDADLDPVVVVDDNGTPGNLGDDFSPTYTGGDNGDGILNPSEVWYYAHNGTAQAGQYANNATATGTPPVGDPVSDSDPSHYFGSPVGIHIEKHTNGEDADAPTGPLIVAGGSVTWTYNVTNTGALNLSGILVTDDHLGVTPVYVSGDDGDGVLNPGESWIYQATGVAAAGQYVNTGTVVGYYGALPVTDSDPSHYLGLGPGIHIEKYTNGQDADLPTGPSIPVGGTVNWTYYITNTGDVALTGINVTDNQPGVTPVYVSGDDGDGALNVTEIWIYQATGVAVVGQYANIGTVVGYYGAVPVTDSDPSHYLGLGPGIDIEKHTNGIDADTAPGPYISINSTVNWTYIVTNTGDLDLTGIVVTDDHVGVIPVYVSGDNGDSILNPGEIWIYQASGIAQAGQYVNIGNVTGTPPVGADVFDSDPSHYYNRPAVVGWETYPVNKLRVLLPWIALLAAIIAGVSLLVVRHRRVTS